MGNGADLRPDPALELTARRSQRQAETKAGILQIGTQLPYRLLGEQIPRRLLETWLEKVDIDNFVLGAADAQRKTRRGDDGLVVACDRADWSADVR